MTGRTVVLVSVLVTAGCAAPGGTPEPDPGAATLQAMFDGATNVVDLTHAVSADAPYWPGPDRSPFRHDTLATNEDGSPMMAAYAVPEHFGTHIDAPVHGGAGLASVDRIPLADLFGPAVVIDVVEHGASDPDYAVTVDDLTDWEAEHGPIPDGAIVLARTGWAARWGEGAAYYAVGEDGRMHFPGFGAEAARFLVEERAIAGIGSDAGSVDIGAADGLPVHAVVNGAGRFHLENLADLSALPESGAWLIVAPIKIEGGSGGQVRVFGVLP